MKAAKLLGLGLSAFMTSHAFAHQLPDNQVDSFERLTNQVVSLQQQNLVPKIDVNFIVQKTNERVVSVAHANTDLLEQHCTVNIEVNNKIDTGFLGTKINHEELKGIVSPSNLHQSQLNNDFITYHEMGHCRLAEIKEPFKSDNKNAQYILNKYFQHGAVSISNSNSEKYNNSLYDNLQENFADTFGFVQLVHKHGADKDLLALMQKIQIERSDLSNTLNKDYLIAHNTEFSLKEALKEDNINKIINAKSQQELEDIALKIANKGMWEAIKTYGDVDSVNNQFTLQDGALLFFKDIALKNIHEKNGTLKEKNIHVDLENNELYQIGQTTFNELNTKFDLKSLTSEQELNDFLKKNESKISEVVGNHLFEQIDLDSKKGIDVFDTVENHMKTVNVMEKQTLDQLKSSGVEKIKNAENIADNLSMKSVLNNMKSIRQASLNNNSTVHIKYNQ